MSRRQLTPEVLAEEGREAVLEVSFCSDPLPTLSVWHWGSLQLQTGHSQGRFTADQVTQVSREGRGHSGEERGLRGHSGEERGLRGHSDEERKQIGHSGEERGQRGHSGEERGLRGLSGEERGQRERERALR